MERKTALDYLDEINFEDRATDCKDYDGNRDYDAAVSLKKDTEQAMQTFANQEKEAEAVGFHEWMERNTERQTDNIWYCHEDEQNHNSLTTLYQLFTASKEKRV
jgi:hypothetical protein